MKNLYSQLSDLTPEQRALFERRLREKGMKKPTSTEFNVALPCRNYLILGSAAALVCSTV